MKTLVVSKEIKCSFCELPVKEMVDGKTIFGPWANMCFSCYRIFGVGLGTGRGQAYKIELRSKNKESGSVNWGLVAGCFLIFLSGIFIAWLISVVVFSILAPIN